MNGTIGVSWEGLSAETIAQRCGAARVELFDEVESTQDVVHALAEQGAPAGTVVVADAQTAGRGRMGRRWSSAPGAGVWCTLLERPAASAASEVLSLRVGLYCAEALDRLADFRVGVKWPNDLVILSDAPNVILSEAKDLPPGVILSEAKDLQFRKLGGILVEARWTGATLASIAIGIGINVRVPQDVPDAAGLSASTSRSDVLAAVVRAARSAASKAGELDDDEMRRYSARDVLAGRRIASPAVGQVVGITSSGALLVRTVRGDVQVRSGTIQLAGEAGNDGSRREGTS